MSSARLTPLLESLHEHPLPLREVAILAYENLPLLVCRAACEGPRELVQNSLGDRVHGFAEA